MTLDYDYDSGVSTCTHGVHRLENPDLNVVTYEVNSVY